MELLYLVPPPASSPLHHHIDIKIITNDRRLEGKYFINNYITKYCMMIDILISYPKKTRFTKEL